MEIIIDIETLPSGERLAKEAIKAPGSYKKPESIQKWLDENAEAEIEKEYRKRALVPHLCQVCAIGIHIKETEFTFSTDEKECMLWLNDRIKQLPSPHAAIWVGFNIRTFDIPILRQRAWKYGLRSLIVALNQKVTDLMDDFTGSRSKEYLVSKDSVCEFFGVPVDGDSGSQVYDWFLAGEYEEISKHVVNDVNKEYELFKLMYV